MKILFDHQIFSSQPVGGVSRYHVELIKKLDASWEISLFRSNNLYLPEIMPVRRFLPNLKFPGKNRMLEVLNRFRSVEALLAGKFDLFHPTFYSSYCLKYLGKHPMALTVHDMIHDVSPELPAAAWEKREKRRMVAAAKIILVPSEFTAGELMRLYGVESRRIRVVPHGAPPRLCWRAPEYPNRFVFVGGRSFYKNFKVVLSALRQVPQAGLLCVGSPFTPAEESAIAELGLKDRVEQRRVGDDGELQEIYADSAALIFSSRAEGFGLPVLEAFAAGCPAILSDIPVFREVAGEAAMFFPPDSAATLADHMQQTMKKRLTAGIAEQLSRFSWERTAAETESAYEEALK